MANIRFDRSSFLDAVVRTLDCSQAEPDARARSLYKLLRNATPVKIMYLESDYRGRHYSLNSLAPEVLPVVSAPTDGMLEQSSSAVAALMSFDRSGYLRENGVAALAADSGPFPLPFLLLRLNDPVEQVSGLARAAVVERLTPQHVDLIVQMLPLLDGLLRRRRAGGLAQMVEDLLRDTGRDALWRGAESDDPLLRASCLRQLVHTEPVATIEAAFATRDPALWQWAAQVATSSRLTLADQDAVLPLLENSGSPRIRLRAVRARARRTNEDAHLLRAMLDADARVRYHSRAALYARGRTDLAPQIYRDALVPGSASESESTIIGALGGLADLGGQGDVARVLEYITHSKTRVRAEAWRTLSILAPREVELRAGLLAGDPSGRVRRFLPGDAPPGASSENDRS